MSRLYVRWLKCWSFSISPSNKYYLGLISFRINWFDLCCPRDPPESSPTSHCQSINSLAFSLFYGPTLTSIYDYWKNPALTIRTFVSKVTYLLLNTLSRFVIDSLPKSKHLLISWLQSLSTVILEPKKIVYHCFYFSPFYFP